MGKGTDILFGPPGEPTPGIPTSQAVARRLGLDSPAGKSAQFSLYRTSFPVGVDPERAGLAPALSQELVAKLAEIPR